MTAAASVASRAAELQFPWHPWQGGGEHVVAEITGRTLKSIQRDRSLGIGVPCKILNGTSVRYRVADILAWIEAQPAGGGREGGVV
jgi:hypothetical protein